MDNIAYEYVFMNNFNVEIFNNGPFTTDELLTLVQDAANSISEVLVNNPGIKKFSSFVNYDTNVYMVTVMSV
jgi:hypothetical protein